MSGPTREEFADATEEYWHDRPPASLEDVMALYGVLAVAESGGALYGTPSKLDPFVDKGRVVTIHLDLIDEEVPYEKIDVDVLRADDVPKLAYSHKSSGRGAKYSLTQIGSKNGNDAAVVASTILGRIRSWTTQDSVRSVIGDDGHPDAWVIERLAEIFEKGSDTLERIASDIESLLPEDDSVPTVLTVRCRIDGATLEQSDTEDIRRFWPAELDVLDAAMRRYATANATDKNIDSGPASEGEGIGVVSGKAERVVGTPESPLGVFSVKHPDAQPGLRQDQSWRNYPVSEDVAMLFSKGQNLIERCVFRRGGTETYAIPYFAGELTPMKAETLYRAIQSLDPDSDHSDAANAPMARVTYDIRDHEDEEVRALGEHELRFYTVSLPISDDKNVIAEEPAASVYWVSELAQALVETVHGPTLTPESGGFAAYNNWDLLDFPEEVDPARRVAFGRIVGHEFTDSALAYRNEEGDDFRRVVDQRLIGGVSLSASMLFEEYMRRFGDEFDGDDPVPHQVVVQQLVHLESLSRAGLLDGLDAPVEPTNEHTMAHDIEDADIDRSDLAAIREFRLESFLDRPLFTENDERRAAALAGVLVGQVSWHQESERDLGRPLDSKTRGDQLTKNGLEHAVKTALEQAKVYAFDSEYDSDVLFPETVDRLLETTDRLPTEWAIEKRDLQFTYVLGHAHGRRSMANAFDLRETDESSEDEPTEAPAN
jgi:CRISPR-associated protein Cas8b/Csh1 subtype I-B